MDRPKLSMSLIAAAGMAALASHSKLPNRCWKPDGTSATGSITKAERKRRNRKEKIAKASRKRNRRQSVDGQQKRVTMNSGQTKRSSVIPSPEMQIERRHPDLGMAYAVLAPLVLEARAFLQCGEADKAAAALDEAKAVVDAVMTGAVITGAVEGAADTQGDTR